MNPIPGPTGWLELAIMTAAAGAVLVSGLRNPARAWRWGLACTGIVFACSVLACSAFYLSRWFGLENDPSFVADWTEARLLIIDELNAPLIPVLGLIHFLTALATGRTKMRRFSLSWSLVSLAIRLAILGSTASWILVALLIACVIPPYVELCNRGQSTRIYVLHMAVFSGLLVLGWAFVDPAAGRQQQSGWASIPLLLAILIRCGIAPMHCWLTDWFEHASFGKALLFVTPMIGVFAAIRLVLPIAPDWVLNCLAGVSLLTAVYAAGLAIVQNEARRFFAYLFLSHVSLILVGLELHTPISLAGALALWISASLSLAGFGLTLRALEARFGRLSLGRFHGLYEHTPMLAIFFLLTGLASIGFPGTLGFVASELVVDGAVQSNLFIGLGMILTAALNGISIVRAYSRLFMGTPHVSTISLGISLRERIAVLTLTALILGGGLVPQPGIVSRYEAAIAILKHRNNRLGQVHEPDPEHQQGIHHD